MSEIDRPDTDIVECPYCHGAKKLKYTWFEVACSSCYGQGVMTIRRKKALEKGGY